jgi:hypothetical protein
MNTLKQELENMANNLDKFEKVSVIYKEGDSWNFLVGKETSNIDLLEAKAHLELFTFNRAMKANYVQLDN